MAGSPSPDELLALLRAHPPTLQSLTRDVPAERLATPEPDAWSPLDVLAHMKSCADVWGDYLGRILSHDRPAIRAVSPRTYIRGTDYRARRFAPLLDEFVAQRASLMATLEPLAAEQWARTAIVTAVGKPYPRTVRDYAERLATHEREHVLQIERILTPVASG